MRNSFWVLKLSLVWIRRKRTYILDLYKYLSRLIVNILAKY